MTPLPTSAPYPAASRTVPLDLALSFIAAGVPVFPCRNADMETDDFDQDTGEVVILKAKSPLTSNGFKSATTSERIVRIHWDRSPEAMIGIPTGEQIGAWVLDVDAKPDSGVSGYETLAALEATHDQLPATATVTTANGGRHYFFTHVPGLRNRGALGPGLDVRGSGGYVIAAGSRMADGRAYAWVDHDGPGLPPIADAPQWLIDLIMPKHVEAPAYSPGEFRSEGHNPAYVARAVQDELEQLAGAPHGTRNNALNDASFSLGQFVGAGALSEYDARSQLEEIAKQWTNFPLSKGTIKRGLAAGIAHPRDIPEAEHREEATAVTIDVSNLIRNTLARQAAELASPVEPAPPAANDNEEEAEYKLQVTSDLNALTHPGGLVEDMIDWITSSAEQPSRVLALAAVLPFVAALAGNRYSTGSRDTRPNIYTVALAESGFGKEHARSQIKRALMESHGVLDKFGGPARIMSASALREVLEANASVNCQIDEFGGFVRNITDRNAGPHQQAISVDLRDYYSASSTFFEGAAYRGSPPKRIYNPNLCIHGTSTPEQFWNALSSASAEDGLLPRLILFHVDGAKPESVKPDQDVRWVPSMLLERMAKVAGIDVVKQRTVFQKAMAASQPVGANKPYIVPWTDDAMILFGLVKQSVDAEEAKVPQEARPFVRRILENATKLALIASVGIDPTEPRITEATMEWAADLAWSCAATMIAQVADRLADNQREANYKRIAGLIKAAGAGGLTKGRLADKVKAIESRQRDDILKDLQEAGNVSLVKKETKGRASERLVWAA